MKFELVFRQNGKAKVIKNSEVVEALSNKNVIRKGTTFEAQGIKFEVMSCEQIGDRKRVVFMKY